MGKIRFAVMINGRTLRNWQAECIEKILKEADSELVTYISNPALSIKKKQNSFQKIFRKNAVYTYLLNRLFRVPEDDQVEIKSQIPVMECSPELKGKFSEYFYETDIHTIKNLELDFILRFGYNILRGDILKVARFGIWSFHHGDERFFRGGPPAFWEIMKKAPSTGVILQKLTSKLDSGCILLRRDYITVFHSFREMRQRLLSENTDMPLLAIRKYIINKDLIPESTDIQAKIYHFPGDFRTIWFLITLVYNRIIFYLKKLFQYEQWVIVHGRLDLGQDADIKSFTNNVYDCNFIRPDSKQRFYADPFVLQSREETEIVFENYSYKSGIGCISIWNAKSGITDILQKEFHLSFPYVFHFQHSKWIIPEEAESGQCWAYEWTETGLTGKQYKLMDQPVVDPAFLIQEGHFYLFCGLKNDLPNEKLYIFHSETFDGPYLPHFLNPVKVSCAGARPGGNFIFRENYVFRPAQIYQYYYGSKILINKLLKLSPEVFDEVNECVLGPESFGKRNCGLHTLSIEGDHFSVDVKRHRYGLIAFRMRVKETRQRKSSHDC